MKELDDLAQEWVKNKNIIDRTFLIQIFRAEGGDILTNSEKNRAVGFLPFPGTLVMYFFEVTKNDRLKYIDGRGININEGSKSRLFFAIKLCELRRDIDDKDEDANNIYQ